MRRVWLRVEYQIRLGWTKGPTPTAALSPDAVVTWGPAEMGKLFAAARSETIVTDRPTDDAGAAIVLEQWLALHRHVEARIRVSLGAKARTPLLDILRAFELTPRQWATLMFALMPEVDPNLVHAYRYLARDATCRGLDGRLLAQLVYDTPQTRSLMGRDLSPTSPLLRYRLCDLSSTAGPLDSLLFRRIRASTRLVSLLDGTVVALDPVRAEIAELHGPPATGAVPAVTPSSARRRRFAAARSCSRSKANAASARSCCSSSRRRSGRSACW